MEKEDYVKHCFSQRTMRFQVSVVYKTIIGKCMIAFNASSISGDDTEHEDLARRFKTGII